MHAGLTGLYWLYSFNIDYTFDFRDDRRIFSCEIQGPAAYNIRGKTNKGLDVCKAPIIGELLKGLSKEKSPGPAAYHRVDSDKWVYRKWPSYTMREKTKTLKSSIETGNEHSFKFRPILSKTYVPLSGITR